MEATLREYMIDWRQKSYNVFDGDAPFYEKWAMLIELLTGVKIESTPVPLQRYALANTCAILISQRCNIEMTY
jgi:hypothetical protein